MTVFSYYVSIKKLETQLGQMSAHLNTSPKGGLPSDMVANPKIDAYIMVIVTSSG